MISAVKGLRELRPGWRTEILEIGTPHRGGLCDVTLGWLLTGNVSSLARDAMAIYRVTSRAPTGRGEARRRPTAPRRYGVRRHVGHQSVAVYHGTTPDDAIYPAGFRDAFLDNSLSARLSRVIIVYTT